MRKTNEATSGFNPTLTVYFYALLLLFFLIQRVVTSDHVKVFFGIIIILTLALSLHGILQYPRLLPFGSGKFAIKGSFDNPAGFAAALTCVFPFCFLLFSRKSKYLRYVAIAALVIMAAAVFLSGSRAGMVAVVAATAFWMIQRFKNSKIQKSLRIQWATKLVIAVLFIALPVVLYFFKKDSANGRLLIWRCTLDMVAERPVIGHGHGAFQAKYMLYQAAYLNAHPDSQYALLADNVLHPFNEYLLILSEHGLIGFGALTLSVFFLICAYRRNPNDEKSAALISILALAVFSFFSYPFKYPFTWVILFLNVTIIFNPEIQKFKNSKIPGILNWIPRMAIFVLSAVLLICTLMLTRAEITWRRIAHQALAGQTLKVLPEYDKLYTWLGKNGLFLYNHAAELHEAKEYENGYIEYSYGVMVASTSSLQLGWNGYSYSIPSGSSGMTGSKRVNFSDL